MDNEARLLLDHMYSLHRNSFRKAADSIMSTAWRRLTGNSGTTMSIQCKSGAIVVVVLQNPNAESRTLWMLLNGVTSTDSHGSPCNLEMVLSGSGLAARLLVVKLFTNSGLKLNTTTGDLRRQRSSLSLKLEAINYSWKASTRILDDEILFFRRNLRFSPGFFMKKR